MLKESVALMKETIKGRRGTICGQAIGYYAIIFAISFVLGIGTGIAQAIQPILGNILTIIASIVNAFLSVGIYKYGYNLIKGNQKFGDFFEGITNFKLSLKVIAAMLLILLKILLGSLVGLAIFVILMFAGQKALATIILYLAIVIYAIIVSYQYSLTFYSFVENEKAPIIASMREMRKLMKGQKFKLFLASLYVVWPVIVLYFGFAIMSVGALTSGVMGNVNNGAILGLMALLFLIALIVFAIVLLPNMIAIAPAFYFSLKGKNGLYSGNGMTNSALNNGDVNTNFQDPFAISDNDELK